MEGQPKYQPKPGKGPHCHMAPVSLLSPRKSDVLLTTMLAAMTSGSTQIDSTKKVYSKAGRSRGRTTETVSDLRFPGLSRPPTAMLTKLEHRAANGGVTVSWAPPLQPWEASSRRGNYTSLSQHSATQPQCSQTTGSHKGRLQASREATTQLEGVPRRSHLVAVLFSKVKDHRSPFSGGIGSIKNLGPNWGEFRTLA